jgi:hypothetical protein
LLSSLYEIIPGTAEKEEIIEAAPKLQFLEQPP